MERFTATLKRKIGPFTIGVWLVIIVLGVGLGLMLRRRLGNRVIAGDESASGLTTSPAYSPGLDGLPPTQGAPTVVQQDFESVTAIRKEQDRFRDELDRIALGEEERQGETLDILEKFFTEVNERIDVITMPKEPSTSPTSPKPKPVPTSPTTRDAEYTRIKNAILNIFNEEQLEPPSQQRLDRLIIEVKQGRTLADIRKGLEDFKRHRPQLGIPV